MYKLKWSCNGVNSLFFLDSINTEHFSVRQLIPQCGAISQLEFVMFVSITLKNACMSCLGMQFYILYNDRVGQ